MNTSPARLLLALPLAAALAAAVDAAPRTDVAPLPSEHSDLFREGRIWATFAMDPSLAAYDIEVDVEGARVVLEGAVESAVDRELAESIAFSTPGVTRVDNRLEIDPALVGKRPRDNAAMRYQQAVNDAAIAARVRSLLHWNNYTDGFEITVKADDGRVVLTGDVDTSNSAQVAERLARSVAGVAAVDNRLTIEPDVDGQVLVASDGDGKLGDRWVLARVRSVLDFSSEVDADAIEVSIDDGRITLAGEVASESDKRQAIDLAQAIRGVTGVDADQLDVTQAVADSDQD